MTSEGERYYWGRGVAPRKKSNANTNTTNCRSDPDRLVAEIEEEMTTTRQEPGYWCVICQRFLEADEYGVIVHDNVPHPDDMTFDEDEKPQ